MDLGALLLRGGEGRGKRGTGREEREGRAEEAGGGKEGGKGKERTTAIPNFLGPGWG